MSQKSFGLLQGKKGIVFGPLDEKSIAWHIALVAFRGHDHSCWAFPARIVSPTAPEAQK